MTADARPEVDPVASLNWELACQNPDCYDHGTVTHLALKWCGCEPWLCSDCAHDMVRRRDLIGEWCCPICLDYTHPETRYGDAWTLLPLRGRP